MGIKRIVQFSVAVILLVATLAGGGVASAQENPDYTAPAPTVAVTSPPIQPLQPATPATPATPANTPLPVTGADVVQMLVIGGVLIGGGAGLLTIRRRSAA